MAILQEVYPGHLEYIDPDQAKSLLSIEDEKNIKRTRKKPKTGKSGKIKSGIRKEKGGVGKIVFPG